LITDGKLPIGLIVRPASAEAHFIRAGAIDICYEGRQAPAGLMRILRTLPARLSATTPQALEQILAEDPETAPVIDRVNDGAAPDAQCVSDRLGGNPGQWRRFLCGKEFERMFFWAHATGFVGRILYIVHGDFECASMPSDITYRGMTFLNYPPVHPHSQHAPMPADTVYEHMSTDLDEADVVLGPQKKLASFVDSIRSRVSDCDMVMISWSCTPTVIGDDMDAAIGRCRAAQGAPILVNSINFRMQESFSMFEELFKQVRARPGFLEGPRDPASVNLLDCQDRFFDEELGDLLAAMGLRENLRLFPKIDVRSLDRYLKAEVQVLPERLKSVKTVQRAVADLPIRTVYAPAPFGIAGAREYVRAIGCAFGKEDRAMAAWDRLWQRIRPDWERLAEQARQLRLAFVADEASVEALASPEFQFGVPVVKVLGEMGFGIVFLVYAPGDRLPAGAAKLRQLPWFCAPAELRFFRDPPELARLLREGEFRAVYSDIFFDFRITEAGKAQFSMRQFEPGLKGALRTFQRLLGLCRLPFYERYRGFLQRVPRGRDV